MQVQTPNASPAECQHAQAPAAQLLLSMPPKINVHSAPKPIKECSNASPAERQHAQAPAAQLLLSVPPEISVQMSHGIAVDVLNGVALQLANAHRHDAIGGAFHVHDSLCANLWGGEEGRGWKAGRVRGLLSDLGMRGVGWVPMAKALCDRGRP